MAKNKQFQSKTPYMIKRVQYVYIFLNKPLYDALFDMARLVLFM